MANWTNLKNAISEAIYANDNQEITGSILQNVLKGIINTVGANATFAGLAMPNTNPGVPDGPMFYIAVTSGIYHNFGNLTVGTDELAIIHTCFSGEQSWQKIIIPIRDSRITDLQKQIANIKPVVYTNSTITNAPDEEDLTMVANALKLKDRTQGNGKGYKILRTAETFLEQVNTADTIYEIRYSFDLNDATTELPDNIVLKFVGGKITNGTIKLNGKVKIEGDPLFKDVSLIGPGYFDVDKPVLDTQFEHYDGNKAFRNAFAFNHSRLTKDYTITKLILIPHNNPVDVDLGWRTITMEGNPTVPYNVGIDMHRDGSFVDSNGNEITMGNYPKASDPNLFCFDVVFSIRNGKFINHSTYASGGTSSDGWKWVCYRYVIYSRDYRSKSFENLEISTYAGGIGTYLDTTMLNTELPGGFPEMKIRYINCNIEAAYFPIEGGWGDNIIDNCTLKRLKIIIDDETLENPELIPVSTNAENIIASLQNYGDYVISQVGNALITNSNLYGCIENGYAKLATSPVVNISTRIHNCLMSSNTRVGVEDTNAVQQPVAPTSTVEIVNCRCYTGTDVPSNYVAASTSLSIKGAKEVNVDNIYFEVLNLKGVEPDAISCSNNKSSGLADESNVYDTKVSIRNSIFKGNFTNVVFHVATRKIKQVELYNNTFIDKISINGYRYFAFLGVPPTDISVIGENNIVQGACFVFINKTGNYNSDGSGNQITSYYPLFKDWYVRDEKEFPSTATVGKRCYYVESGQHQTIYERNRGVWVPLHSIAKSPDKIVLPVNPDTSENPDGEKDPLPPGFSYYDETKKKPLWYDGDNWIDALGNINY